jgi:decaprenyl-phosphate phosphoribosyltransferase
MRPSQGVKNAFVLAPLIFSRSFFFPDRIAAVCWAAALFWLASAAGYVFNDLQDEAADRCHPEKRLRPLAAGELTRRQAWDLLAALLVVVAGGTAAIPAVAPGIAGYLLLTALYSWKFKHWAWFDIGALACGFVLRVETGILALHVPASPWMLTATAFLSLYLAAVKRSEELLRLGCGARGGLRRYSIAHLRALKFVAALGAVTSYACFTVAIRPSLIPTLVFVIAGIGRFEWRIRAGGGESPSEVVFGDPLLLCVLLLWAGVSTTVLMR